MWEGLDAVEWAGLKHNYGAAGDVPGLLRRCAGPDPDDAEDAADDLLNLLYHQGGWICPAASAALPFLLRLAASPDVRCRGTVLDTVARLASLTDIVAERFLDPAWHPAWERALPEVCALLGDPTPAIRRAAADIIGLCPSPGEATLPPLLRCWQSESDPATRLDLVLALGRAVPREPAGDRAEEATALLRGLLLDSPEPQLRLAVMHGLAAGGSDLAAGVSGIVALGSGFGSGDSGVASGGVGVAAVGLGGLESGGSDSAAGNSARPAGGSDSAAGNSARPAGGSDSAAGNSARPAGGSDSAAGNSARPAGGSDSAAGNSARPAGGSDSAAGNSARPAGGSDSAAGNSARPAGGSDSAAGNSARPAGGSDSAAGNSARPAGGSDSAAENSARPTGGSDLAAENSARPANGSALVSGDSGPPGSALPAAALLDSALRAIRHPSVELWRHTSSVECGVQGVMEWTRKLFTGPSPAFALGLLADHPDDEQRVGALGQAAELLARWRSPVAELLPVIAARLDDPAAEVRFRAAELLACLGPSATAHADEVAALLGDTAARATRVGQTVGEAALWALARMNDPRCVPALAELLTEPPTERRSGFASASAHYPADFHHVVLPSLPEVLDGLPPHAALLSAVRVRLTAADAVDTADTNDVRLLNQLCQTLAGWGPAARAAVPELLRLLRRDGTWTAAATALAGLGTVDDDHEAHGLLLSRSTAEGPDARLAAWAYWRTGGDPGPALSALGPAITDRHPVQALRRLADLGPHAAEHADRLRTLTTATDPWVRAEAAHALWAATPDDPGTETAVSTLLDVLRDLPEGRYLPVHLAAVRYLTRIGPAARPAASRLLREVPSSDRRLAAGGGWRGFHDDEAIRTAIDELLATSDAAHN